VPVQDDPTGPIGWKAVRVDGPGPLAVKAAKKLVREGDLALQHPAISLRLALDGVLARLWADGHTSVAALWDCYARYLYLPRLRDQRVLEAAVQDGPAGIAWSTEGFATADRHDDVAGRYQGLLVAAPPSQVGGTTLVVRPDVAVAQLDGDQEAAARAASDDLRPETIGGTTDAPSTGGRVVTVGGEPPPSAPPAPLNRFHASVRLETMRAGREFSKVIEEVIANLTQHGPVEITVELAASSPTGYPDHVVRTVTENVRVLRFEAGAGFEGGEGGPVTRR